MKIRRILKAVWELHLPLFVSLGIVALSALYIAALEHALNFIKGL